MMSNGKIITGDCLEQLALLDSDSFDATLSDPPYGISFMGAAWDKGVPSSAVWAECLRVLKPGGHLLAFGGTRTHHRLFANIEDGGFLIRDCLMWLYSTGFPKSLNIGKAFDGVLGKQGKGFAVAGHGTYVGTTGNPTTPYTYSTADGQKWQGYGTALKPAWEPICLAMKPTHGTYAEVSGGDIL